MSAPDVLCILILLASNTVAVLLVALSLPGTWLILAFTCVAAWLRWESGLYGWTSILILAALAVTGELIELIAGALGAKQAGGSLWGAAGAFLGGLPGAILGAIFLPVPVLGSVLGAAAGAFCGALLGERFAGREIEDAVASGRGAFLGRLAGTLAKLVIALAMWIVVAFASFL